MCRKRHYKNCKDIVKKEEGRRKREEGRGKKTDRASFLAIGI
jgi:hypothetical protein